MPKLILIGLCLLALVGCGGQPTPTQVVTAPTDAPATAEPTLTATVDVPATAEPTFTSTVDVPATAEPTLTPTADMSAASCPAEILDVLPRLDQICGGAGRNQLCYGSTEVRVEPEAPDFQRPGDLINIANVNSLTIESNLVDRHWGASLLKLQANLPNALPGQNLIFLLFGNLTLQPEASGGAIQAFQLETGIGDSPCAEASDSGVLVQSPFGVGEVSFRVNGVDIALGSTMYLQAASNQALSASVIEGAARISAAGRTEIVPAGLRTTIPLDDQGAPAGPPSAPVPYVASDLRRLPLASLERPIEIADTRLYSEFAADAEGWTIAGASSVTLEQRTSDTGGAYLCGTDADDELWYFSAPDAWIEALRTAYGSTIYFNLSQAERRRQLESADTIRLIAEDGTTLAFRAGENPAVESTTYRAPLLETAGWLYAGTSIRATQAELQSVLQNLAEVQILGQFQRGESSACLDFVQLAAQVAPEISAEGETLRVSQFDSDDEGWTVDGSAVDFVHTDEGAICATDDSFTEAWYFVAPDSWAGDISAAYGGALRFALRQSATDGIQNQVPYNVQLVGANGTRLQYSAVGNPGTTFTNYDVPLIETAGWRTVRGDNATQAQLLAVLGNLATLHIVGEFRYEADTGCLDFAEIIAWS
jgi:hypothetical protein